MRPSEVKARPAGARGVTGRRLAWALALAAAALLAGCGNFRLSCPPQLQACDPDAPYDGPNMYSGEH